MAIKAKCKHNWTRVDRFSQELYPPMWCSRCGTLKSCHYTDYDGRPTWGYRRPSQGFKI